MNAFGTAQVGAMLVSIGAISACDLNEIKQATLALGVPFLKVIVESGYLSQGEMVIALEAIQRVMYNSVELSSARKAYSLACQRGITFTDALNEIDQRANAPAQCQFDRICTILLSAEIVSRETTGVAYRMARLRRVAVEQVLMENQKISDGVFYAVRQLRDLLKARTITDSLATEILRKVKARDISVKRAMAELGLLKSMEVERVRLGELLVKAGFISDKNLNEALKLSVWNDTLIGKMLVTCGFITESTLQNALRCQFLLRQGMTDIQQSVVALHYCEGTDVAVDKVLKELQMCA